jgi:hypothetical protein
MMLAQPDPSSLAEDFSLLQVGGEDDLLIVRGARALQAPDQG